MVKWRGNPKKWRFESQSKLDTRIEGMSFPSERIVGNGRTSDTVVIVLPYASRLIDQQAGTVCPLFESIFESIFEVINTICIC